MGKVVGFFSGRGFSVDAKERGEDWSVRATIPGRLRQVDATILRSGRLLVYCFRPEGGLQTNAVVVDNENVFAKRGMKEVLAEAYERGA